MEKFHRTMALTARSLIGVVFVGSGFVKSVDPMGTAYKIEEYLRAFGWNFFVEYATFLAFALVAFEMVLGLCLIGGLWQRSLSWVSTVFLTLLTALTLLVALTNPVSDCGCFGDAIHLSNWQTFEKNLVLWLLSLLLLLYPRPLPCPIPGFLHPWAPWVFLTIPLVLSTVSYRHLPLIDFRPFRVGTYLPDKMVVTDGSDRDSVMIRYVMERQGERRTFTIDQLPTDSDWQFIDREEVVIRRGKTPPIHDFALTTELGEDITAQVLSDTAYTLLVVMPYIEEARRSSMDDLAALETRQAAGRLSLYALSASPAYEARKWAYEYGWTMPFCSVDALTLKTMVRSNPGLVLLKQGVVVRKWAARDTQQAVKYLDNLFNNK